MKIPVYSLDGKKTGEITLAKAFSEKIRTDLIRKTFLVERSKKRQPYGVDPLAGKRTSAHYHGERHYRYSMMNKEMARMKRIHNQGFLNYKARFVPQATKGRKAHPPKTEKVWSKKINRKERIKALMSALAATADRDFVAARGHKLDGIKSLPLVIEDKFQELKKTKDVMKILETLGLKKELERVKDKKIRAGGGKSRGRKYRKKRGPLLIIKEDKGIVKASKNIAGVDVVKPENLDVSLLAPGAEPGRLCIWTRSALEDLKERD